MTASPQKCSVSVSEGFFFSVVHFWHGAPVPFFVFSEEKSTTPSSLANCTNYPLDFCAFRCCRHALRKSADISTFYRHSPKMNRKRYHSQKSNQKHTIIMKGVRRLHWKGSRGCAPCPRSANCLPCRLVRYTYKGAAPSRTIDRKEMSK